MRRCIWCLHEEGKVTFNRLAHIFPHSLGGKRICKNVCDLCNSYFGSKQTGLPSVEIALKEPLNISRMYILSQLNRTQKLPRFKSEYFDYDLKSQLLKPKFKYRLISDFQTSFTKQFKRGVYKIFLKERSESVGDAYSSQFDFIREFARWGIGDYPVFYCRPSLPAVAISVPDIHDPVIRFTQYSEEIMGQYGFYSYYFVTHTLAFPVIRTYEITIEQYLKHILGNEGSMFDRIFPIKSIEDLDFTFAFAFGTK